MKSLSGNDKSFKDIHGYSKVGGVLKSKDTKAALEKKQMRMNAFKPSNKQVVRNDNRKYDRKNSMELSDRDAPLQQYQKKFKKIKKPVFTQ